MVNLVKEFIGTNCWVYPPMRSLRNPAKLGVATKSGDEYFLTRQHERKEIMSCVLKFFGNRRPFSFCSIGSGYGGEEFLIADGRNKIILIEPDNVQYDFLEKKFSEKNTEVIKSYFQFYKFSQQIDCIYSSGLGSWMNSNPMEGFDKDLSLFLNRNLKPDGIGIFLIYGGTHSALILDSFAYLRKLKGTIADSGLMLRRYGLLSKKCAILIASKSSIDVETFAVLPIDVLIKDGEFVNRQIRRRRNKFLVFICTFILGAKILARNVFGALVDFIMSFIVVNQILSKE